MIRALLEPVPLAVAVILAGACSIPPPPAAPRDALALYERIRAALARDDARGVPEVARALADVARRAAAGAPPATRLPLLRLGDAADGLAGTPTSDLAAVRLAFGEVSRGVVSLIVSEPALAEGRYIFRCPMAEGYRKWVQARAELENPYMGSRMLRCGSETEWVE